MRFRRRRICFFFLCDVSPPEVTRPLFLSARVARSEVSKSRNVARRNRRVWSIYLNAQDIHWIPVWNSDVARLPDHANRRKSITKQDVSSTARVLRKEKEKEKKNAMRFLLSHRVCVREQSFLFLPRIACQPMDLLVSSKFVLSQIDVLSFSDCPTMSPNAPVPSTCSLQIRPSPLKSCLSVCVRSIRELAVI